MHSIIHLVEALMVFSKVRSISALFPAIALITKLGMDPLGSMSDREVTLVFPPYTLSMMKPPTWSSALTAFESV